MGVLNYINKNNNVCITEESSFVNFRDKILSKQGINKIIDNINIKISCVELGNFNLIHNQYHEVLFRKKMVSTNVHVLSTDTMNTNQIKE